MIGNSMTLSEYLALQVRPGNKYHAVRTEFEGITFHSKMEANRYGDLLLLKKAGKIRDLELQPKYPLIVNGVKVCTYIADFRYVDVEAGLQVVEDVKGARTEAYRIKKKLTQVLYGIEITEYPEGKQGKKK